MIHKITLCILALLLSLPFSYANDLVIAKKKINKKNVHFLKDTVGYKIYTSDGGGFCIFKDANVVAYSKSGYMDAYLVSYTGIILPQKIKTSKTKKVYDPIPPLLSDIKFNQTEPYNNSLPLVDGEKVFAGCVPVALAQVMKYYNYPPFTIGDIPAFKTKTVGLSMDSIPKNKRFNWQNIAPNYNSKENKEKINAIADLMKTVCTACYTDLNVDKSPSSSENAYRALAKYFAFDIEKLHIITSNHYSRAQFEELVYKELARNRPVLLVGHNHAFVLDGYEDGLFHINLGWGGTMNGFYEMSLLAAEPTDVNADKDFILRVALGTVPKIGETEPPMTANLWVSNFTNPELNENLSSSGDVSGTILCTVHANSFKDIVSHVNAGYTDENGKWVLIGTDGFTFKGECGYGYGDVIHINFKAKDNTTYRIYPLEKCEGKGWEPMENSNFNYFDIEVKNCKVSYTLPKPYELKADISFEDKEDGKYVKLDVANSGYDDYCDTFFVKMDGGKDYLDKPDLFVPSNGKASVLCKLTDSLMGSDYGVRVYDSNKNILAEAFVGQDRVKDHVEVNIDDSIAQDSVAQDSIVAPAKTPVVIDSAAISSSVIAIGLLLLLLLFVFFKVLG